MDTDVLDVSADCHLKVSQRVKIGSSEGIFHVVGDDDALSHLGLQIVCGLSRPGLSARFPLAIRIWMAAAGFQRITSGESAWPSPRGRASDQDWEPFAESD